MTLAVIADWDAELLRATAEHFQPSEDDDDIDPPCGHHLLISAAIISERPPESRLRNLAVLNDGG